MIQKAFIKTRATATYLRENLTNLDTYTYKINLEIENFNQYVKVNMDGLKSRGDQTDDLTTNLFKAHQVESDGEFL